MPTPKYVVALTPEQRQRAEVVARSYKHAKLERNRAHILLLADTTPDETRRTDKQIAAQVGVCIVTVEQVRRRFVGNGLDAALFRKPQTNRKARALDGHAEAFLIATTCSAPPEGKKRWSLALLAERLIALDYVDGISPETVRRTLKKTNSSPG